MTGTDIQTPRTRLEYSVLDGETHETDLGPGDAWTFGRSQDCTETLTLPQLSRLALFVQSLEGGVVRIGSRQSNRGRVLITSDDGLEHHVITSEAGPVHVGTGNYSLRVELPPVVLRMQLFVPSHAGHATPPQVARRGARVDERTAMSWTPEPGPVEGQAWITVAALAVTLARYPELVSARPEARGPTRTSDALRRAAAAWCGHTSSYWVNERLKEAVAAADLVVPDGGERLAVVVSHYEEFFSDATLRAVRDELSQMLAQP